MDVTSALLTQAVNTEFGLVHLLVPAVNKVYILEGDSLHCILRSGRKVVDP